MNTNFQQSDKILLNMFSVHRFFLEIVDEMQKIVTSDRQRDYMLNWDPKTGLTFINAIKYYLNQQPQLFKEARDNFIQKQNPYYFDSERTTKKSKNKSCKDEKNESATSKAGTSVKDQLTSKITEIKEEANDDSFSNDLEDVPTFDQLLKASLTKTEKTEPVKQTIKEEPETRFKPAFEEQESEMKDQSDDQDDDDNGIFYDNAYRKANAIIYGNFTSRGLKRRPKMEDRIYLQLHNCFVKMISNGRDAFFERMYLQLFKIETTDVKL